MATIASADLLLQMNAVDPTLTTALGLLNLTSGQSYNGFGKINFHTGLAGDPYFWTLRFPPKSLIVTRLSDTEWTIEWAPIEPGVVATLQCTTIKRPTVITDDSEWVMPFKITVTQVP